MVKHGLRSLSGWNDEEFLNELRSDPKAAIEKLNKEISDRIMASEGKYFPITKERPPELQGLTEEDHGEN